MKRFKAILSVVLVLSIFSLCFVQAFAAENTAVSPEEKISSELAEKMAEADEDELIPVWIWYQDIDQDEVDRETEKEIGFSKDECSVITETLPIDLSNSMLANTEKTIEGLNTYLERTSKEREKEEERSQEYIETRREISVEKYKKMGDIIINEAGMCKENVIFRSELAPMIIAKLKAQEIITVSKYTIIEGVSSFDLTMEEAYINKPDRSITYLANMTTTAEVAQNSMGLNEVYERLDLSGEGIKIGIVDNNVPGVTGSDEVMMLDLGYDSHNIINVSYSESQIDNIQSIVNNEISQSDYSDDIKIIVIVDQDHFSNYTMPDYSSEQNIHSHANNTARIIMGSIDGIAKDSIVYSTYLDTSNFSFNFMNIEALIKCGINIMVQNYGYTYFNSYIDFINNLTKYLDHIVYEHKVLIVNAGGNKKNSNTYYGEWITPYGLSYNGITVGGYSAVLDLNDTIICTRKDYRWKNKDNDTSFCEKPDVLFPANYYGGGTSVASPALGAVLSLLYELKPSLKLFPHVTKAIVLASCHRKANPCDIPDVGDNTENMYNGITERQGAGIPDAWIMAQIILQGTYAYGNINSGSTIYFNVNLNAYQNYDMNYSITWLRRTTAVNSHFNYSDITEYGIPDLNLYLENEYSGDGMISSTLSCSSTEMCYFKMNNTTSPYQFRIENTNSNSGALLACAWSTSDREKELHHLDLTGTKAVGKTISVKGYCNDGTQAPVNALSYQWKRSTDGVNWTDISGATMSSYTLTTNDILNYIKCEAMPLNSSIVSSTNKEVATSHRIVLYGDANLDGFVTTEDVITIQHYCAQLIILSDEAFLAADVNGSGNVNITDASIISMYLNGLIQSFPVEN